MPILIAILLSVWTAVTALAGTTAVHRSERIVTGGGSTQTLLQIVRNDDDSFVRWERNGVRYITRDRGVIAAVEKAFERHTRVSREHAALGRKHAALGREHAALGREHARLGREHARAARRDHWTSEIEAEARRRDFEAQQRTLERKQEELERKQDALEREQQALERQQRATEGETDRLVDEIFERAVREGKASRE